MQRNWIRPGKAARWGLWAVTFAALGGASGCLKSEFVNEVAGGGVVPLAPGDTPFISVVVVNKTTKYTFDFVIGYQPSSTGFNAYGLSNVQPQVQLGVVLSCPVEEIGIGDPSDLTRPAMVLYTGQKSTTTAQTIDGVSGTVNVPYSAFPLTLKSGQDYECGDAVVFTVVEDPNSGYGINIYAGRVDGTTQTGPFSGPDTYEILDLLLFLNGGGTPTIVQ